MWADAQRDGRPAEYRWRPLQTFRNSIDCIKIARSIWEVGVAGWPVTGRRRGGVLNITAAAWTAGFQWWRSDNITRTQNVSEYMLVLAVPS